MSKLLSLKMPWVFLKTNKQPKLPRLNNLSL
jgi:hypothetical protein